MALFKTQKTLLAVSFALSSLSCTEGIPNFDDLGKSLNPPSFNQRGNHYTISSLTEAVTFEGSCDRRGNQIHLRHPSGEWTDALQVSASGGNLSCTEQKFNFRIENLGQWMGFSGTNGEERVLKFRFSGPLFVSVESEVTVRFWNAAQQHLALGRLQGFTSLAEPDAFNATDNYWAEYTLGESLQGIRVHSPEPEPKYSGVLSVQGILTQF